MFGFEDDLQESIRTRADCVTANIPIMWLYDRIQEGEWKRIRGKIGAGGKEPNADRREGTHHATII